MGKADLVPGILDVLAGIRARPEADLVAQVEREGMDSVTLTSHEVVAILVTLQPVTGIDPSDPGVLRGCSVQSLQHLVGFVTDAAEATA